MNTRMWCAVAVAAAAVVPMMVRAQQPQYPVTLIAPGKGPYTFPPGYQTPWDTIDIRVTEKMSPNLFVLHGSPGLDPAHPEASGGRAMVLFGADGVLMNTGVAQAQDPEAMALAMNHAVQAGRLAYLAGRIPKKLYATASSPLEGVSR